MENYVVTFARGFGTGGKEIASKLAKELGIHCYENRILTLASQMSGLDEKLFQEVNEKVRSNGGFSSFLKGLPRAKSYISRNEKFVSDDKLFEAGCHEPIGVYATWKNEKKLCVRVMNARSGSVKRETFEREMEDAN